MNEIKRVVMIGPESTGKTEMAGFLAGHYKTAWLPEFAREYIESLDRRYNFNDVEIIAKRQLALEKEYVNKANVFLFIDTDLIITKVWFDVVFNECPAWIEKSILETPRHLYLLFKPDIPWVYDSVRENPHKREALYQLYIDELNKFGFKYSIVEGQGEKRFKNGIFHVDRSIR